MPLNNATALCPFMYFFRSPFGRVTVVARRSSVLGFALKTARRNQHIFPYVIDNNSVINHLPMQKVILRPAPVFMLISVCSSVSGDSQETRKCCVTRGLSQGLARKDQHVRVSGDLRLVPLEGDADLTRNEHDGGCVCFPKRELLCEGQCPVCSERKLIWKGGCPNPKALPTPTDPCKECRAGKASLRRLSLSIFGPSSKPF